MPTASKIERGVLSRTGEHIVSPGAIAEVRVSTAIPHNDHLRPPPTNRNTGFTTIGTHGGLVGERNDQ